MCGAVCTRMGKWLPCSCAFAECAMCDLCVPRLTRRRALALAGAATAAVFVGASSSSVSAYQAAYGVTIQPRETWAGDGRPFLGTPAGEDVRFLLVHHTAGSAGNDPLATMRSIYDFHTSAEKGWPDVAYNFFIDPDGGVYEARAGSLANAIEASATGGSQGFAQLVCLLGDFTNQNPTAAALASLNGTLAWLADTYGVDTTPGAQTSFVSRGSNRWEQGVTVTANTISGHRDMSQTACPGDTFYPYLVANVPGEVSALRGAVPAPSTTQAPQPSSTPPPEIDASTTSTAPATTQANTSTTSPPETTLPPTTVPATVANGPVVTPPLPAADESAIDAPAEAGDEGQDSANGTALALAAAAAVVIGGAAVFVGVRGRHDDSDWPEPGGPPAPQSSGGADPLV